MAKLKKQLGDNTSSFLVNSEILHNGEIYAAGEEIDLEEVYSAPLLNVGVISKKTTTEDAEQLVQ